MGVAHPRSTPTIDVYAASCTFADTDQLAVDLATTVMTIEQVPNIPMSARTRQPSCTSSRVGSGQRRRRLDRRAGAGADQRRSPRPGPHLVLLTKAPEGGWGLHGVAHMNAELVTAARAEIAALQAAAAERDPQN